ncbi:16020_t:CDS:1 [Cetraspora pellucida]|uniref:16020_t:CDS:1 n=1 Tax=Cetraspora pellucida TaxID=1433469 RepID=A0ACA9LHF3_9GLOM|nr:16020_t:CDS:1 [Cetraspora pellucida]
MSQESIFWGENNKIYMVDFLDKEFKLKKTHVIEALMISFQDIYFDSKNIWNRIIGFPLTLESYRIHKNIKNIRNIFNQMINDNNGNEAVKYIIEESIKYNLSLDILLDDLIVTTSSGLNIIKLTIMSIIWHLYNEKNSKWKTDILKEIHNIEIDYEKIAKCKILNAFIYEVLRYESSFSLLNNQAINDFDLDVNSRKYKIKKGTMIMPNAYVIHHNNSSWNETSDLNIFDPSRFINNNYLGSDFFIPFGKGIRRCSGKKYSLTIIRIFVFLFLLNYPEYKLEKNDNKNIRFSLFSDINFNIII